MSQHTLGPWKTSEIEISMGDQYQQWQQEVFEISAGNIWIAYVQRNVFDGSEHNRQMQSNARLIAAAPDMLKALIELVAAIEDAGGHDENGDVFDITDACKAIAYAEGREP